MLAANCKKQLLSLRLVRPRQDQGYGSGLLCSGPLQLFLWIRDGTWCDPFKILKKHTSIFLINKQ